MRLNETLRLYDTLRYFVILWETSVLLWDFVILFCVYKEADIRFISHSHSPVPGCCSWSILILYTVSDISFSSLVPSHRHDCCWCVCEWVLRWCHHDLAWFGFRAHFTSVLTVTKTLILFGYNRVLLGWLVFVFSHFSCFFLPSLYLFEPYSKPWAYCR